MKYLKTILNRRGLVLSFIFGAFAFFLDSLASGATSGFLAFVVAFGAMYSVFILFGMLSAVSDYMDAPSPALEPSERSLAEWSRFPPPSSDFHGLKFEETGFAESDFVRGEFSESVDNNRHFIPLDFANKRSLDALRQSELIASKFAFKIMAEKVFASLRLLHPVPGSMIEKDAAFAAAVEAIKKSGEATFGKGFSIDFQTVEGRRVEPITVKFP
jgi:hypothetical protein